jgi:Zn-dependent protease
LITTGLFFGSVLFHELAHSAVALAWKIPVRSITLFIFGGVAEIEREADRPLAEFLVAIAGPASSVALAAGFGLLWGAGSLLGLEVLAALGLYLASINLTLAVFNMVPGFPLDGGRVFRSVVWGLTGNRVRATRWAAGLGRGVAWLMILGGFFLLVRGNVANGLWLTFIGFFLDSAASQSAQQAWLQAALEGYTVGQFAVTSCATVDENMPLDWLVRDHVMPTGRQCFVVQQDDQVRGVATVGDIRQVPRHQWGWTPVKSIMTPFSQLKAVDSSDSAYAVLVRMLREGVGQLPVVDGNRLVGFIGSDQLMHVARTRTALGV